MFLSISNEGLINLIHFLLIYFGLVVDDLGPSNFAVGCFLKNGETLCFDPGNLVVRDVLWRLVNHPGSVWNNVGVFQCSVLEVVDLVSCHHQVIDSSARCPCFPFALPSGCIWVGLARVFIDDTILDLKGLLLGSILGLFVSLLEGPLAQYLPGFGVTILLVCLLIIGVLGTHWLCKGLLLLDLLSGWIVLVHLLRFGALKMGLLVGSDDLRLGGFFFFCLIIFLLIFLLRERTRLVILPFEGRHIVRGLHIHGALGFLLHVLVLGLG